MNLLQTKRLPTSEELKLEIPLSAKTIKDIRKHRLEIENILSGKDRRLLIIIGPCSAFPHDAVLEFAEKLKDLEPKLKEQLKIVMRVYIQKPRTVDGWKGPLNQPDPFSNPDIAAGMRYSRLLMKKVVERGLPIADEALSTHNSNIFSELISYIAIGARSSEDQEHRIHASALPVAVGIKNPTSGSVDIATNSVVAAQKSHTTVFEGNQITTAGNQFAHLVLRGGISGPNYHLENLFYAQKLLLEKKVKNPSVVIDASHDNCKINGKKNPKQQVNVVMMTLEAMHLCPDLKPLIKGFMIESFLKEGSQNIDSLNADSIDLGGLSITDPCMDFKTTEKLLLEVSTKHSSL